MLDSGIFTSAAGFATVESESPACVQSLALPPPLVAVAIPAAPTTSIPATNAFPIVCSFIFCLFQFFRLPVNKQQWEIRKVSFVCKVTK